MEELDMSREWPLQLLVRQLADFAARADHEREHTEAEGRADRNLRSFLSTLSDDDVLKIHTLMCSGRDHLDGTHDGAESIFVGPAAAPPSPSCTAEFAE